MDTNIKIDMSYINLDKIDSLFQKCVLNEKDSFDNLLNECVSQLILNKEHPIVEIYTNDPPQFKLIQTNTVYDIDELCDLLSTVLIEPVNKMIDEYN